MGVTGSRKSSFISSCSEKDVKIGHDLNACTSTVTVYPYELSPSRTAYLIDTPGFDDTNRSDAEVLGAIATWLGDSYKNKILLHGIIYLHQISDIRMHGSAKRNLLTFKELCGEKALGKVILATTMWDRVTEEEGARREKELQERPEFWGWMLSKGSSYYRLDATAGSKRRIVRLLADHDKPIATDIQKQLVDERRTLDETSAGREVQSELVREREKWEREREEIKRQVEEAIKQNDQEAREALEEGRERFAVMINKVEENTTDIEKRMNEREASYGKKLERPESDQMHIKQEEAILELKASELPIQTPSKGPNSVSSYRTINTTPQSPFSVSSYKRHCILTSRACHYKTGEHPSDYLDMKWRESASLGSDGTWIASYHGGIWQNHKSLKKYYPELVAEIYSHGLNNLDVCFLGPNHRYFVRWKTGRMSYRTEKPINALFEELGSQIVTAAFGCGGTFLLSYGTDLTCLNTFQDLKGYYPRLQRLILDNDGLNIVALTLNPDSVYDYIIIYTKSGAQGPYYIDWKMKSDETSKCIRHWWNRFISTSNQNEEFVRE
ncbi:hypothetical protein F4803DRAFT_550466 [Xylaria telfairii]|nr:hypothetical protein F4803DRAFT_550466 [Xylaria telfairii]